jgi:Nuclease-related domain
MPPLNSRVWRRYGQLRIYVSAANDPVGWFDPRTGRSHLSRPDRRDGFWAAVRAACQSLLRDGQISESALPPSALPPSALPPEASPTVQWQAPADLPVAQSAARPPPSAQPRVAGDPDRDDLARNAPGASASAQARALRREHPLLTGAAAMLGIRTSARQFAAGARGERTVGRQLNRWATRHGWYVLHAVPVGQRGADIDHVVIGPFGVVTVNTKTTGTAVWAGEYGLTIGGKSVDYLRKSRHEADRAGRLLHRATGLEVPVQPAIVFVGAPKVTVRGGGPAGVAVLPTPQALHRWLRRQPPALQPDQVEAIYEAARRPASWRGR